MIVRNVDRSLLRTLTAILGDVVRLVGYGEALVPRLSRDLQARFGRGFEVTNLSQMRAFYLTHREILRTPSEKSTLVARSRKFQTVSEKLLDHDALATIAGSFPLPWSHYARLLAVRSADARHFYETEALRGGWSIRQLDRQLGTQFYERTALSRNKANMLRRGHEWARITLYAVPDT